MAMIGLGHGGPGFRANAGVVITAKLAAHFIERTHTISSGHLGRALRNALPYLLVSTRLSSTTTIPRSDLARINLPTPCRNFKIASGSENSKNELPPRASMLSTRASING